MDGETQALGERASPLWTPEAHQQIPGPVDQSEPLLVAQSLTAAICSSVGVYLPTCFPLGKMARG